jgi:hypothetical protein
VIGAVEKERIAHADGGLDAHKRVVMYSVMNASSLTPMANNPLKSIDHPRRLLLSWKEAGKWQPQQPPP